MNAPEKTLAQMARENAEKLEAIANESQHVDTETMQHLIIEMTDLLQIAFRLIEQLEEKAGQ